MKRLYRISDIFFFGVLILFSACAPKWVTNYEGETAGKPVERRPGEKRKTEPQKNEPAVKNRIPLSEKSYEKFRKEVQRFWGAPYVWGGASPKGTDCSGLVKTIYSRALNMNLPHSTRLLYKKGKPVSVDELEMGDLVFFGDGRSLTPTHVGIFIADGMFLHASVSKGVALSHLSKAPYNRLYLGARRLLH
ncbi:MAG: NlpC/P60 family protein [Actinobacteria bacterium]|nr:NlpC/P60 family protein [Actinomycetota bacterium]